MKKNKTFRVLGLFDYNAATGFGTVSHNIVSRLEKEFEGQMYMDIIALNYFGENYKTKFKNVLSGPLVDKNKDIYGRNEFLNMLNQLDYDLVFMINDLGVINPMIPVMKDIKAKKKKANKKQFKTMFYFPVDAPYLEHEFMALDFYDVLVPYTQYAKNMVSEYDPLLKTRMNVILHGVNTKDFMELEKDVRDEFRKAYFGEKNFERYIIGNINRNQPRKDIPATIFAFKEYQTDYDDKAMLYLHMNPKDEMGHDLRFICSQLELVENEDYMFPPQELIDKQPEPKYLCMIYNALDVFVTTTTGEGFGLTVLEAMQCGVPVIAPKHTSLTELLYACGETYYSLDAERFMAQHFDSVVRYQVDPVNVADAIAGVRQYEQATAQRVENAKQLAATLNWDTITEKWIELFKKTL